MGLIKKKIEEGELRGLMCVCNGRIEGSKLSLYRAVNGTPPKLGASRPSKMTQYVAPQQPRPASERQCIVYLSNALDQFRSRTGIIAEMSYSLTYMI